VRGCESESGCESLIGCGCETESEAERPSRDSKSENAEIAGLGAGHATASKA